MRRRQKRRYLFAGLLVWGMTVIGNAYQMEVEAAQGEVFSVAENFEEMVIVDNENCCFKITGIEEDGFWGYTWKVYAENKTDKTLMFAFDNVAVNGYMCDPFWAKEVAAGMKANDDISWFSSDFESNGISEVENVVFTLRVSDSDDWLADPYLETIYTVESAKDITVQSVTAASDVIDEENTEERIIVDNENCFFSIKGMRDDEIWGYTWDVYLENRTDKTMMFSLNDVCVNGFVCDPYWAEEITAGMKSNASISWMDNSFEQNGITNLTEVEFVFSVSDSDDWLAEPVLKEKYVVYPQGEEAVEAFERIPVEGEQIVVDNEYCTLIVTGFAEDDIWGYGMNVYLENKTDKKVMFSTDNVAVNGYMCDPYWATTIPAEKRSNTALTWFSNVFEENGITQVEEITGVIKVCDEETFTEYVNETFRIVTQN